jgi:polysaccharide pyruvyl transferase WcaK-like protein
MLSAGRPSVTSPDDTIYRSYVENLGEVAGWLVRRGYGVRFLAGDRLDAGVVQELRDVATERLPEDAHERIMYAPAGTAEELLSQIGATDFVLATRFHNIVFALLCNKPVIAISFHQKCESLMQAIGLERYCLDGNRFRAENVTESFLELEANAESLKRLVSERVGEFRRQLDQQYEHVFDEIWQSLTARESPGDGVPAAAGK